MNRIKNLKNLVILEKLIRQERTSRPKQLAKRLSISCRTLFRKINELNAHGTEIKFCRTRKTYYYNNEGVINIHFNIKSTAQ